MIFEQYRACPVCFLINASLCFVQVYGQPPHGILRDQVSGPQWRDFQESWDVSNTAGMDLLQARDVPIPNAPLPLCRSSIVNFSGADQVSKRA